jgi:isoamylase
MNAQSVKLPHTVTSGRPHPLGATPDAGGVNFSVFSYAAYKIVLLLFEKHDDPEPYQIIELDPRKHKTFHIWHVYVVGLRPGVHYAYRADGPRNAYDGHRFNPSKVLIDPHALGNTNLLWDRGSACGEGDNIATSLRSIVIDAQDYDWEGDVPLNRPMKDTIIYEMHVGGFTKSPTAHIGNPGTFKAVIEKIPYLQKLGVTAVELLPVMEFDDKEVVRIGPDGSLLKNYWGYSTVSFWAPHRGYCLSPEEGTHLTEFRDMVKALHKAGIEVILDVVFNHTNEGNHQGPTINFRGLDNQTYYHLCSSDRRYYMDYSGCGNSLNCNHPIVAKFIREALEFWVLKMHVDGFRFDEGSILSRGLDGAPMQYPPALWNLELAEELADTKLIAEAWDANGLYQIGKFPGYRWAEWNGFFRDNLRRFVKGDPGIIGEVASVIAGSADLYESSAHSPLNSINFITCHDGFTLNDLVSYNHKDNWRNGEGNNDGITDNLSWNCGVEGMTNNPEIDALRRRQIKNFCTLLFLAQGVPMFPMGDEARRSQQGNNNPYCQDNELSWFNWNDVKKNNEIFRFFCQMIEFRKRHPELTRGRFFDGTLNKRGLRDISWHGCTLNQPAWGDPEARALSFTLGGEDENADIHVMANMFWEPLTFEFPLVAGRQWYRVIDTARPMPEDIAHDGSESMMAGSIYLVNDRSVVVLVSK